MRRASRLSKRVSPTLSASFGRIDGAVNCVGSLLLKPAHLTPESDWSQAIAANLTSAFATVRGAAKTMLKTGGSVVLMSSAAARIGLASHEAIAAAKGGHHWLNNVGGRLLRG